jgi:DNA polymerase-3 subunit epsilon
MGLFRKGKTGPAGGRTRKQPGEIALSPHQVTYVILDTELTGLDRRRDSILSIGALKMSGGRIEMGRTFYQVVNPGSEMKKETVVIHEITPSEVSEKPGIEKVISGFLHFCADHVLVGHYIGMDLHFINREMKRCLGQTLENLSLDTMRLADWLRWKSSGRAWNGFNPKNYQLHEIAKELGIHVQGAHNSLMDAYMTAQVLQRLFPRLLAGGIDTLGKLLEIGNPSRKLRVQEMMETVF